MIRPKGMKLWRGRIPIQIRVYDNQGASLDRFTVVYPTPGPWQHYASMGATPEEAFGTLSHDVHRYPIDEMKADGSRNGGPPDFGKRHPWLGKRIRFNDLPFQCQKVVLRDYQEIWGFAPANS